VYATVPDLLRLLAVPVFGWAAYRDIKTRRVPNRTWYPLAALGVALLVWEGSRALAVDDRFFLLQVGISLGFVIPLATAFWYMGSFGGADAKAFYVLALLFPVYPAFYLDFGALPLVATPVRVFSLTILSNTVLVGVAYPLGVAVTNLLRGHTGWAMLIGKPVAVPDLTEEYGLMLETPDGLTRSGLDLDALRMYLDWRGIDLAALRAAPERYRDPTLRPAARSDPGDGAIATDGGRAGPVTPVFERVDTRPADPWGAEAFLADLDGSAYGTTPESLRDALEVIAKAETVWVSPGIPFLVPTFFGLVLAFTYGDVLFAVIRAVGLS
jgi:preflagellin peptidase FlaK